MIERLFDIMGRMDGRSGAAPTVEAAGDRDDVEVNVGDLDDVEVTGRFRALELQLRATEAEMAAVIAEADRRSLHLLDGHRSLRGWLRANANWSNTQVTRRRRLAHLIDTIPEAGEALAAGHIGVAQADELARVRANPRCGDRLIQVAPLLLEHAEHLSFEDSRTCIRRWELLADLDGAHRDRAANIDARTAVVTELDGTLHVSASGGSALDAAGMAAIFERHVEREFHADVTARDARCGPGAPKDLLARTDAQRRFDALRAIFHKADTADETGRARQPLVNIVCDEYTFEYGLADHGIVPMPTDLLEPDPRDRRCETDTGIPLLPDDIVQAALQGHIRRVVRDSAGVIIDLGREQRLFTSGARAAAKLMARRCTYPGCTVSVTGADVDHADEWVRDQGVTNPANSTILCRSHNRHKHRAHITVERNNAGYLIYRRADHTPIQPVGQRPPPAGDPFADPEFRRTFADLCDRLSDRQPGE
jgi:hypothetical protein